MWPEDSTLTENRMYTVFPRPVNHRSGTISEVPRRCATRNACVLFPTGNFLAVSADLWSAWAFHGNCENYEFFSWFPWFEYSTACALGRFLKKTDWRRRNRDAVARLLIWAPICDDEDWTCSALQQKAREEGNSMWKAQISWMNGRRLGPSLLNDYSR